ncbi:hypothetical protein D8674_001738 [Pyrus ussuriensis x Pyrus communis]|uniref:Uncharacterized protein n=1 Tax=Pyrus ussuriensis x Pyrus communis TaxID=2448454 RepID=A0A5N5F6Y3_9ROSA|nr:hypothetical protein D8674_001738 [Pyrus ussuriensis x Pyrus communis]
MSDITFGSINGHNRVKLTFLAGMCTIDDRWLIFHGCNVIQFGISQWPRLACPDSACGPCRTSLFSKMDRDSSAGGWNSFRKKMVGNSTFPSCSPVRMIELFESISSEVARCLGQGLENSDYPLFRRRHL